MWILVLKYSIFKPTIPRTELSRIIVDLMHVHAFIFSSKFLAYFEEGPYVGSLPYNDIHLFPLYAHTMVLISDGI